MIQLIIHQIWMQDDHSFRINTDLSSKIKIINDSTAPNELKKLMNKTVKINNDFKYILWCKKNITELIHKHYFQFYEDFLKMTFIQQIDFSKIIIVHHYGGIYLDCDIKPIRPLITLISRLPENKLIVSKSAKLNNIETILLENIFDIKNTIKVNNGVIISSKNNNILLVICHHIINRIRNINIGIINNILTKNSQINTMRTTGPAFLTSFVKKNEDNNNIILLNNQIFEPCLGSNPFCKETELSYGKHLHKSLWFAGGSFWQVSSIYFYFKKYWFIFVIFIIIFFMFLHKYLKINMFR